MAWVEILRTESMDEAQAAREHHVMTAGNGRTAFVTSCVDDATELADVNWGWAVIAQVADDDPRAVEAARRVLSHVPSTS